MKKNLFTALGVVTFFLISTGSVFAHSVVLPKQVGVATLQDFTLEVPSEKDASTVNVKLLLPPGLNFVSPVVKPGWKIEVKSGPIPSGMSAPVAADGDVASTIPTEIDWTGGTIPTQQKDIFIFSAQVPSQETELDWKIYQGYSDGSTVSWELGPFDKQPINTKGTPSFDEKGPYSKTMVINDLKSVPLQATASAKKPDSSQALSLVAILLSSVALGMQLLKK